MCVFVCASVRACVRVYVRTCVGACVHTRVSVFIMYVCEYLNEIKERRGQYFNMLMNKENQRVETEEIDPNQAMTRNISEGETETALKGMKSGKAEGADSCKRDMTQAGLKEENATNRAEWRKKLISYTGDPR